MINRRSFIKSIFSFFKSEDKQNSSENNLKNYIPQSFETISFETSYACNLKCKMCPRFYQEGEPALMKPEHFLLFQKYFKMFKFVFLTGYGEPLINPDLPKQLSIVKNEGCYACFATNGILLKGELLNKIIASGVDEISVSIDAGKAETYEYVRERGTFSALLDNLKEANKRFSEIKDKPPYLHWVYVMMKYNVAEIKTAVELASDLGFTKFTLKHLESAQSKEGLKDALFNTEIAEDLTEDEEKKFQECLNKAQEAAKKTNLIFTIHPRKFSVNNTCLVNPLSNIFIDCKGNVSACCYLNMYQMMPYNDHKPKWNGVIGNFTKTPFEELLRDERYLQFRESWSNGIPPDCCTGCLQIKRMFYN